MRIFRIVPAGLFEAAARLANYLVGVVKPHAGYKAERIVRGRYWGLVFGARDLHIGRGVQFEGTRFRIGDGVRLYDGGQYVTGSKGWVHIGSGTHISRMSIVSGIGGVDIGAGCAISAQVTIYSTTTNTKVAELGSTPAKREPVRIGDNVYIGSGARIIPGVSIGDDCVIAAGAVVIRDVPAGSLAKGVPAVSTPLAARPDALRIDG